MIGWRATYRLQLTADVGFADAAELLPYLAQLGISHLYLSPVLEAVAGSTTASAGPPTVAIGVASQYSSTVPVRADGTPAGPVVMWRDRRGTEACHELLGTPGLFELWVERHGIPPIGGGLSLGHLLHLVGEDPDGDTRFVEVMDYVTARLTGRLTATRHSMLTGQLCDNRSPDPLDDASLRYDPALLASAGIGADRLPPLVGPHEPVGPVTDAVASRLGVAADSMVATGVNDTAAVALATGATSTDGQVAAMSIGTTGVLVTGIGGKSEDLDHEILTMPAPDGGYLVMAENGLGGRVPEAMLALLDGGDGGDGRVEARFAEAEAALATTAPGAGGVIALPWLAGSMAPSGSSSARGGYLGVSLETTRAQLIRATFEGVAHNLAWLLGHVEAFIGHRVTEIRLTGGGAAVTGWPQVIADVLDRPVRVAPHPGSAVARGVGLRALGQGGVVGADPGDELAARPSLEPDPAARDVYDRHQRAFEQAFAALEPVWPDLDA
ncbi:MAG: hypothetical protein KDB04_17165 [Acidimicrobiales bacterium]|nr:hypothetical protein [Acidimicrobiales bacterium]